MYYVKRKVGSDFVVKDSDTGSESIYSLKALRNFCKSVEPVKGTGYAGFDLKFDGDKVIALPLTEDFYCQALKDSMNNGFVLTIPDIVTHISDNFLVSPRGYVVSSNFTKFSVVLPESLIEIGSNALCDWSVSNINGGISLSETRISVEVLRNKSVFIDSLRVNGVSK